MMYLYGALFLIFGISIILLLLLQIFIKKNQLNLPTPPGLPIIGHALQLRSTTTLLNVLMDFKHNYGDAFHLYIGLRQIAVISDYKFLEFILTNQKLISKSADYEFFNPWLGLGLLTSDGPRWRKHRKMITPAFHMQILGSFIDVFETCGQKLVDKLKGEVDKNSTDIYDFITLCTLDIICETAMGISINAQDLSTSDYVLSVKDMGQIVIGRSTSPIKMYDALFTLTPDYYRQKRALQILHGHTNSVIAKRIEERQKLGKQENAKCDIGIKAKKAFLDLLLETTIDGKNLTAQDIREEVDTFMFAGHDTTASAISYCLYSLAQHPDIQKQVLEEQDALFNGKRDPVVTQNDLQNMRYLEMVIKETLRLYPSVPFYGRKVREAFEYDGVRYPKDMTIMIFAYGIHRDSKYFEDPKAFNPSRFENITGKYPYAFIPFSAGPRNCIGQRFAMLEMKATIAKVVRNFELCATTPEHKLELSSESILKSANGVKITLKLRK